MNSHLHIALDSPPAGTGPGGVIRGSDIVALRSISTWDIPEILIAHQDDRELAAALGLARPPSAAQLGAEVETAAVDWAAGTLKLTVLVPGSDDCRGRLVIDELDAAAGTARAVIWIAPSWRGRGLARAAVALAGDWLARDSGIERLRCCDAIAHAASERQPRRTLAAWACSIRSTMKRSPHRPGTSGRRGRSSSR
jgi:RimJ/RimL family protein N-acetyltransferase